MHNSSSSEKSQAAAGSSTSSQPARKRTPDDFIFGKVIGEGSYSTVFLAKEINSGREVAIKVLDKKHIMKEKKAPYAHREKEVMSKLDHPFFVRLYYTFQDPDRLYFVLTYAKRGELLDYINKLGCFDEKATQFYAAEIVLALEYLHSHGIIHRDLKPENILLGEDMHILITDFGTARVLQKTSALSQGEEESRERKNSFVGTAQYVSPEVLNGKLAHYSQDLWALGCIIYQLSSGQLPFWGGHEYAIFQKITKEEYDFPEGFNPVTKDLVSKLLKLNPKERLGCEEMGGYDELKKHPFFDGIDWDTLATTKPPELLPYLPAIGQDEENFWSQYKAGLDDKKMSELMGLELSRDFSDESEKSKQRLSEEERKRKLEIQAEENPYNKFVENHLIIKQGLLDKRVGLFARRRMFLLTEGPELYYVDPQNMVLKGKIPWSKDLRTEAKNFKIFFVHTPNRTYYLEDQAGNALKWCKKLDEVFKEYYEDS